MTIPGGTSSFTIEDAGARGRDRDLRRQAHQRHRLRDRPLGAARAGLGRGGQRRLRVRRTGSQPQSGDLTFAAGETQKTISIQTYADGTPEPDETFGIHLSHPVNVPIGDADATGTILNDDRDFTSVAPNVLPNTGPMTVTLRGGGLTSQMSARIRNPSMVLLTSIETLDVKSSRLLCMSSITAERGIWGYGTVPSDLVIYLTQDAIPYREDALERLCVPFADPSVGVVYGRQLPRAEASAIERHGRDFNYTSTSEWRQWPRDHALGYRAMFCSNAFAAYRRTALEQIGGFPEHIIQGEDQVAAAIALLAGWTVVYAGGAEVEHSHGYSLLAEFRRYFDIGVCDRINQSLFAPFGTANGAGRRFVASELRYLLRHAPSRIPEAEIRTFLKLLGYHLGQRHTMLPLLVKRHLAMNPMFYARKAPAH